MMGFLVYVKYVLDQLTVFDAYWPWLQKFSRNFIEIY